MAKKILIINGPNLNMLGTREPGIYGTASLDDIKAQCVDVGRSQNLDVDFRQSNHEGDLIEWIQKSPGEFAGIIINPAAYSHTSIGLADALSAVNLPVIEVHISNIFARETFRHHSYVSPVVSGVICGLGPAGYTHALNAIGELI
ncbi:MAG: type II 3-dehydroquinate dehydratase [Devosiaceae bacterium]|nr:type II 3-dehydroquinate dehydratase [Devosiaceae bacterium]